MNLPRYAIGSVAGLITAVALWSLLFYVQFGTPINSSSRWTGESLRIKQEAARAIQTPKIGIIAGSSGHFSVSAELIEIVLGRRVVNLSLHAGLGFPYILHKAREVLCRRDIAILAPEYEVYFTSRERTDMLIDHIVAQDRNFFLSVGPIEQLAIVGGIGASRLLKGILTRWGLSLPPPTTGYSANTISRWGDEQGNLGSHYSGPSRPIQSEMISSSTPGIRAILEFLEWAKSQDVRVLVSFPPYPIGADQQSIDALEQVTSFWQQKEVSILGIPMEYFYPDSLFFDTGYHLNTEGRTIHTQALIAHIVGTFASFSAAANGEHVCN